MNFIETTEISERALRRLAQSRGYTLVKDDLSYTIGEGLAAGISLSDDECWALLSSLPSVPPQGGKVRTIL